MKPKQIDFDVDNVDADGLAATNDSSGATLTLDGALTSGGTYTSVDGFAHQISILDTATVDQSGATFTVTGTDADGHAQTEAITGPTSGAAVESSKYFKTISSIAIASGAGSGTVSVGTVDEVASKTYVLPHSEQNAAVFQVDVTGTINYDIQVTLQDPYTRGLAAPFDFDDQEDLAWVNDGNFGAKTADLLSPLAQPGARAFRIVTNSYTDTAELQVYATFPRVNV